ncbi:ArsR family transcriptional regulator [Catellatospora sichuanensis]|uniref:arsenate reductase/protein-tyrosine-phosphatase family protein n=1 Tax=Catellatospora sichuanensis TaxID=1969805 RepID=UPI001183468F|nr:ArsR family transcriptional regulator [Catellatospora sichuanensis]
MDAEWSTVKLVSRARIHAALGEPARLAIVDALALGDASPGEISQRLGLATNLVAHHLKVLQEAEIVERSRSEGDRRRTYLRLRPEALAGLTPPPLRPVRRVVFVCTHNSARSQLAAALWTARSDVPAASAGTTPAARVHPRAVAAAARYGLAIAQAATAHVDDVLRRDDLVVAVCDNAHEQLPADPVSRLHWSIPDPAPIDTDAAFEAALTDIAQRVERLAPALPPGA